MQVIYLGRAPRTKETLPDFLKWRRVTRHPLVFHGLTGSQLTPGFWGVTWTLSSCNSTSAILCGVVEIGDMPGCNSMQKSTSLGGGNPSNSSGKTSSY